MTNESARPSSVIGIVGEDAEAAAFAVSLARAGSRVLYWPANAAMKPPLERGIERASTLTDLAYEADIVLAAIGDTVRLRSLVLGSPDRAGLAAEMKSGATLVDLGARTPRELRALLGTVGRRGISLVDAAILGETLEISEGRCIVFVGGFPDAVAAVTPTLRAFGKTEATGPLGSAHATAALMGYLEASHSIAREQTIALGRSCGIEPAVISRLVHNTIVSADRGRRDSSVVPLIQRAELAKRIAEDGEISAQIIDFAARRRGGGDSESR